MLTASPDRLAALLSSDPEALFAFADVVGCAYGLTGAAVGAAFRRDDGAAQLVALLQRLGARVIIDDDDREQIESQRHTALWLLGNLCCDAVDSASEDTRDQLLAGGGDEVLVACVQLQDDDEGVCLALGALQNLTANTPWCEALLARGIRPDLEALLSHHDERIVRYSSGSLSNIASAVASSGAGLATPVMSVEAMRSIKARQQRAQLEQFVQRRATRRLRAGVRAIKERRRQQAAQQAAAAAATVRSKPSKRAMAKLAALRLAARPSELSPSPAQEDELSTAPPQPPRTQQVAQPPQQPRQQDQRRKPQPPPPPVRPLGQYEERLSPRMSPQTSPRTSPRTSQVHWGAAKAAAGAAARFKPPAADAARRRSMSEAVAALDAAMEAELAALGAAAAQYAAAPPPTVLYPCRGGRTSLEASSSVSMSVAVQRMHTCMLRRAVSLWAHGATQRCLGLAGASWRRAALLRRWRRYAAVEARIDMLHIRAMHHSRSRPRGWLSWYWRALVRMAAARRARRRVQRQLWQTADERWRLATLSRLNGLDADAIDVAGAMASSGGEASRQQQGTQQAREVLWRWRVLARTHHATDVILAASLLCGPGPRQRDLCHAFCSWAASVLPQVCPSADAHARHDAHHHPRASQHWPKALSFNAGFKVGASRKAALRAGEPQPPLSHSLASPRPPSPCAPSPRPPGSPRRPSGREPADSNGRPPLVSSFTAHRLLYQARVAAEAAREDAAEALAARTLAEDAWYTARAKGLLRAAPSCLLQQRRLEQDGEAAKLPVVHRGNHATLLAAEELATSEHS